MAERVGAFFDKKPERHLTPHIYISTVSDARKRKAKARERAVKQRAAAEAERVATKGAGRILKAKTRAPDSASAREEAAALENEEGFMQRVKLQKKDTSSRKGIGLWTMFHDRFARTPRAVTKPVPVEAEAVSLPIDLANDSFLQHASVMPDEPAVRTESAFRPPNGRQPSALEEVAERERPAPSAKDRAERAKQIAEAMKENADIKEEPAPEPPPVPVSTVPKPIRKKAHTPQFQNKQGFRAFLTALNYIGMGKERMMFVQNMAMMLNAGLPLTDSLKTLVLETSNRSMRKVIQRIIDAVENGSPLWRAMEAQQFFSLHALALVRIGEEAGNLSENMGYLAEQDEKDHALRSKVKMAMIYPTIVLSIMFVIVVGLGTFVLPNLIGVLFSLNVKLPLITRIVIKCSDLFTEYGAIVVPGSLVTFFLIIILSKYTRLRVVTQWVLFKIPGIGRLAREATIARFGVILGGLMKAGVPVIEALQSLVEVTPIASYKNLYSKILAHITIGDSFSKSFASIKGSGKLLPASVQQLVITGEKSGSLANIMLKIADIYDKKASETAQKLPIILEPILLLFIGGLVGSIAFAIIVPIYSIVGTIGG